MRPKRTVLALIGISLFFAFAILVSDRMLQGSPHNQTAMYLLIALWWIPFSYLTVKEQVPVREEIASRER